MVSNRRELKDIKGGRVNNVALEPKDCNLTLDSNCKASQPWAEYQEQLWSLFYQDCNFVNSFNDISQVTCVNTSDVMYVCDPVVGNQLCGTVGEYPDYGSLSNGDDASHGSQNDRIMSMNLPNHEHYLASKTIIGHNINHQKPQPVRQPHNCTPQVGAYIGQYSWPQGCSTRWCTVQFMNKYWADTEVNTSLVFISDGDSFQKFCYWNQKVGSNEIMISECKGEALGFLQVSHTVQILINFNVCHDSNPKLAFDNFVKDCNSKNLGFQSYSEYMCHIIDAMIEQIDENTSNDATGRQTVMGAVESTAVRRHISPDHICHQFDASPDVVIRDFHDQTKTRGFLAHTSMEFKFIGPDRAPPPTTTTLLDYIHMATVIQATGLPNYKLARFPIQSGLNIQAWRHHLKGYYNKKLLEYLTYGFPLSLHTDTCLNNTSVANHYSAKQFPADIKLYLDKEISLGAILGPFPDITFQKFHCSPLLTRPKDNGKRRVILDLSFPKGASVNDAVHRDAFDGTPFTLKFSTVDDILEGIRSSKGRVLLSKIDIARAFRNLRIDPVDAFRFGIHWGGQYFLDVAAAFGWIHGTASFQMVSDAILYIMRQVNCSIFAYIDDFIMISPENDAERHFHKLHDLFSDLGLPMNQDKVTPPTRVLTCLGITIDLDNNSLSIEKSKMDQILEECILVSKKHTPTRKQFQSLLGKLLYLHKCIKPARIFVNRILAIFRDNSHKNRIKLTKDFHKDIGWFTNFLPFFSGSTKIFKDEVSAINSLHIDACLTGVGGVWNSRVYAAPIPTFVGLNPSIVHLEMINVLIALRVWAPLWAQSTVKFSCDNLAVVQVVTSGKTKDSFLNACLRNIWLVTATHDINLLIEHIEGKKNIIADSLSRIFSQKGISDNMYHHLSHNFTWDKVPIHFFDLNLHI